MGVIETGLQNPYDLIFKELSAANKKLRHEIDARIESEKKREHLIHGICQECARKYYPDYDIYEDGL